MERTVLFQTFLIELAKLTGDRVRDIECQLELLLDKFPGGFDGHKRIAFAAAWTSKRTDAAQALRRHLVCRSPAFLR